mmetsp:Transcript_28246/g.81693  ORF Transcript_28246/g.81693 Transcript_28246/m.81693 type:complete len:95 (-) Transcript_28246:1463-1747(-)
MVHTCQCTTFNSTSSLGTDDGRPSSVTQNLKNTARVRERHQQLPSLRSQLCLPTTHFHSYVSFRSSADLDACILRIKSLVLNPLVRGSGRAIPI